MSTARGDIIGVLRLRKNILSHERYRLLPSWQQPRTQVTLSELIPRQYGRIAYAILRELMYISSIYQIGFHRNVRGLPLKHHL